VVRPLAAVALATAVAVVTLVLEGQQQDLLKEFTAEIHM